MQGGSQGFWTQKLACGQCSPLLPPQLNFLFVDCQFYIKKSFPRTLTSMVLDIVSSPVHTQSLAPSVRHGGPQDHLPEIPGPGPASWIPLCPLSQPGEALEEKPPPQALPPSISLAAHGGHRLLSTPQNAKPLTATLNFNPAEDLAGL